MWKLIESPLMEKFVTLWNRIWSPKQANKSEPCGAPSRVLICFGYCCLLLPLTTIFLFTLTYTHLYPSIPIPYAPRSRIRAEGGAGGEWGEASPSLPLPFTLHMKPFESHRIEFHRGRSRPFEAIEAIWGHSHPGSEASNPERPHRILQHPERPHLISKGVKFHKQAHWPLE